MSLKKNWTSKELIEAIKKSNSFSDLLRKLNENVNSYNRKQLKKELKKMNINSKILKEKSLYFNKGRSWTDEDLIKAVKENLSITDVMRYLNLSTTAGNRKTIKRHIDRLDLNINHFSIDKRTWTDEDLIKAVKENNSFADVKRQLGLTGGGSHIKKYIIKLNLDTSHFKYHANKRTWTDEDLIKAVKENNSFADVKRQLGLKGGNDSIKKYINKLNLDTSHFYTKIPWNKGLKNKIKKNKSSKYKYTLDEILIKNSPYTSSSCLRIRLIKENILKEKCSICGISEWQNKPITFHLHHINGINNDNRIENLIILCPNCHSQTDNYCFKK